MVLHIVVLNFWSSNVHSSWQPKRLKFHLPVWKAFFLSAFFFFHFLLLELYPITIFASKYKVARSSQCHLLLYGDGYLNLKTIFLLGTDESLFHVTVLAERSSVTSHPMPLAQCWLMVRPWGFANAKTQDLSFHPGREEGFVHLKGWGLAVCATLWTAIPWSRPWHED